LELELDTELFALRYETPALTPLFQLSPTIRRDRDEPQRALLLSAPVREDCDIIGTPFLSE